MDSAACKNLGKGELSVRTALELPGETQAEIQRALQARLEAPVKLRFENAPGIGLGLDLRGNGWRIGWSSESYLQTLEEDLREELEHAGAGSKTAGAHAG